MLYSIAEISDKLGYSRVTIYNKVKVLKDDLKDYLKYLNGTTYIDEEGFLIIKNSFNLKENDINENENIDINNDSGALNALNNILKTGQEEYIDSLKDQIEFLKGELSKKDDQLNNTLRLLENSQVLIRENKEKILELETYEKKKSFLDIFRKK